MEEALTLFLYIIWHLRAVLYGGMLKRAADGDGLGCPEGHPQYFVLNSYQINDVKNNIMLFYGTRLLQMLCSAGIC